MHTQHLYQPRWLQAERKSQAVVDAVIEKAVPEEGPAATNGMEIVAHTNPKVPAIAELQPESNEKEGSLLWKRCGPRDAEWAHHPNRNVPRELFLSGSPPAVADAPCQPHEGIAAVV